MTLIVARKHGDMISAVADTKITVHPSLEAGSRRSLREYDAPVLKLAIVRPDLLIGVAGDAPPEALTAAAKHWHKGSAEDVLEALKIYTTSNDNGFVVAALAPARLWRVSNGVVYERTEQGETWEGDAEPYKTFMERYAEWPDSCPVDFRLLSSLQALTDGPWSTQHPSVGGHVLHVQTVDNEFRYVPNGSATFEPTPGNGIFFTQHFATGIGTTPGAFAAFIEGRQQQLLFVHGEPWEHVPVQAETMEELISAAAELHNQQLAAAEPPDSQWQ